MNTLDHKINEANQLLCRILKDYKRPVIYTGFGKDSMVMHHMIRAAGYDFDCMFHRDPFFPQKYRFANRIIDEWNLRCYDYPHSGISLFNEHDTFEVTRHYQVGSGHLIFVARILDPVDFNDTDSYLCAYKDIVKRPMGSSQYVWDLMLNASRTCERKPHLGMTPCGINIHLKHNPGSSDVCYPLKDFTDEEMVEYTMRFNVPWHEERYEIIDGKFKDKPNSDVNPDVRRACSACLKCPGDSVVYCPKSKTTVNSVRDMFPVTHLPK